MVQGGRICHPDRSRSYWTGGKPYRRRKPPCASSQRRRRKRDGHGPDHTDSFRPNPLFDIPIEKMKRIWEMSVFGFEWRDPRNLFISIEGTAVAYDEVTGAKQGGCSPCPTVKGKTGAIFCFSSATCGCA